MSKFFFFLTTVLVLTSCNQNNFKESEVMKTEIASLRSEIEDSRPGLGEIMSVIQQHHAKLYYAGREENWGLASYELDEIKEGLEDASKAHHEFKESIISLKELVPAMTNAGIAKLSEAIVRKNKIEFTKQFQGLTVSCNSCHQAAEHPFIVIQIPTQPEFKNQKFNK